MSWKEAIDNSFHERYQSLIILLSIYLISLFNSAKYERCSSIANRIQTNGHSRIMIEILDVLMNVRSPFPDDLRGNCCREIIEKAYDTWNGKDENRPINRTKLLLNIPDDYVSSR
ncbi:unnamed protein product [Rotaria sordida]|uniref:Uncharacterized protein n=1 Tax=Rotaria sordida TaxID=392033 RepID=A0A814SF89_9BILA|nr:unnamed protein product [Rotaria sordida]CAF1381905.1 unnamed protein product [Rotaria sordida]